MTAKHPDEVRGEDNIEAPSSVIANWLEDDQPRTRMTRYGLRKCLLLNYSPCV